MHRIPILLTSLAAFSAFAGDPPALNIDPERVTVSGISAGGQMAHQLHIAYSDVFSGAAIIAAGPFGCADGSLATAMARCMGTSADSYLMSEQAAAIRDAAAEGELADPDALTDDPVWIFHGALDTTVAAGLSEQLVALYGEFMPAEQILYVDDVDAIHNFPASGNGSECQAMVPPFVGNCGYDAAGELLTHLYPELDPPADEYPAGFAEVSLEGAADAGLSETAYLYIPSACTDAKQVCALHLVLHGCAQSAVQVGTGFMEQSGYLPWAEANDIVLAFPQVVPGATNPYACFDWWGYTNESYLYRDGAQMSVLANWINSL